jgi:hypothetical protein
MYIPQVLNYGPHFEGWWGIRGTAICNLIFDTRWMQFVGFTPCRVSPA